MGNLFLHERLFPTDLFFKNFFDTQTEFQSFTDVKPQYPVDIKVTDAGEYIHRGITRKSFNMGWKIAPRYDLSQIEAVMKNGLLSITIPLFEEAKPKTIKIK